MIFVVIALHVMASNGLVAPLWVFVLCWWLFAVETLLRLLRAVKKRFGDGG